MASCELPLFPLRTVLFPELEVTPSEAFTALKDLMAHPFTESSTQGRGIGLQLLSSLGRVFKGFALATLVGIPLGLAMGASKQVWKALNPIVRYTGAIVLLAASVTPLLLDSVWHGRGDDP